ncbi:MAG TPA: prepilin-type N-terminal cleavage/methylation domain-containing protein [Thermodesulfovibrionales bacterium]|nr:prepilin-type N-terminal cleavage/methylation domain-containing protein [Thermodesulfovibrionales bacterium]
MDFRLFILLSRKGGFTLLELMISIALIGVIVLILTGAMRLGFRSVDAGEKKIEALERIRASLNIVEAQIQSEIPISYIDDEGSGRYYFKGDGTTMEFSTNYSLWSGQMGYVLVHYKVASDGSGQKSLMASENIIGTVAMRETKLFESFSEISFEYFYKGPTDEEGKWVQQWTEDTDIPEKVKLRLFRGAEDLSMIIPMRARGTLSHQPVPSPMQPVPQRPTQRR